MRNPLTIGIVFDYLVILPAMLLMAGGLATLWMSFATPLPAIVFGILFVVWCLVTSYELGYQLYYRRGQRAFFYGAYVVPFAMSGVAYIAGMIWKFG